MSIIKTADDWLRSEINKDRTTISAIIKQSNFSGYIGWVGYGNLGDEAVFEALKSLFPEYGFAQHKGYGTRQHLIALKKHGATSIHRNSFAPVAQAVMARTTLESY